MGHRTMKLFVLATVLSILLLQLVGSKRTKHYLVETKTDEDKYEDYSQWQIPVNSIWSFPEWVPGWCVDSRGRDQNTGVIEKENLNKEACLRFCGNHQGATGCEYHDDRCSIHTRNVAGGNGLSGHSCMVCSSQNLLFITEIYRLLFLYYYY